MDGIGGDPFPAPAEVKVPYYCGCEYGEDERGVRIDKKCKMHDPWNPMAKYLNSSTSWITSGPSAINGVPKPWICRREIGGHCTQREIHELYLAMGGVH